MKHNKARWEPVYRTACVVAGIAAAVFAVMRMGLTPIANNATLTYAFSLCILLLFIAALIAYGALAKKEPIVVRGKSAYVAAAAATVTGVAFLVFTTLSALNWWLYQAMPYPDKAVPSKIDVVFLFALMITGALSAVWMLVVGIRWWRAGQTDSVPMNGLALAPIAWCWARLIRYITSYASLGGLFHNVHEVAMMVFETLFFLLLARVITGVGKRPSRFFISVSLCTGIFCAISALSQVWFFVVQDTASYNTCLLVTAPDFAVAFLAFAVAVAQSIGIPVAEESSEENTTPVYAEEMEDGEGAEFLLSDEWFTVYDPEAEENFDDEDEEWEE